MRPGWHSTCITIFWILINNLTAVIRAHYTIDQFLQMLEKHKVNGASIKPKDVFAAVKSDTIKQVSLESLEILSSSGEHLSTKLANEMQTYLKNGVVKSLYGMTDIGGAITTIAYGPNAPGSIGKIGRNVQLKIVSENGEILGPNEIGEIYAKFTYADFSGYYQNERLTNESKDAEGFFKTEDMAYVNEDGDVFLVERKKFLISYGGEWINQSDIERAVLDNIPGCAGVCAVNVADEVHGEIPIVAVIPEEGRTLDEQEILKVVRASHSFPFETKVMFFDKLPMTISSKFRKYLVRDLILERLK